MTLRDEALALHRNNAGKVEINSKVALVDRQDLNLAYTPGVAEPCKEIHKDPDAVYTYTAKGNLVAVVSDGTAVLGLGDIGPAAALPVMEGKSLLFKGFGGVDAFPVCIATKQVDEIVAFVKMLEPTIGGVNLEDISAPRCFEIETRLKKETSIPIFHDDQHGTAIVVLAALVNGLKVIGRPLSEAKIVVNGAGAAGMSTSLLLFDLGATDLTLCDSRGAIYEGRTEGMNPFKVEISKRSNRRKAKTLAEALEGADVFIGLSVAGAVTREMAAKMRKGGIVIAMANPVPEIFPDEARAAGAAVVGTGRSDFPNQVNNVLAFPGVLRGALDCRASDINEAMKIAAAKAIAGLIEPHELNAEYIIPGALDRRVAPAVAAAVAQAAMDSGVARIKVDPAQVAARTVSLVEKANRKFGQ
ncbi:MAG: malic enzyme-like NAD(P)-binding protein [Bacillota bacterium]|nr:malic enzyme-like NAD(P)-binding protein [Bacillota bacterium]